MRTPSRSLLIAGLAVPLAVLAASPTLAASKRPRSSDTTPPVVAVTSPATGATTGSDLTVAGTASDNKGVRLVALQVDGGAWQPASGTTSWTVPLSGFSAGTHTVTARATDNAGNASSSSVSFTVSTTAVAPAPTATPSPTASPTPTATPAASPSPSPTSTSPTGSAPNAQGTWTSPEGTVISVSTAGSWTIAQVYQLLLDASAGPGDFARVAPMLKVKVQDTYSSGTTSSAVGSPGAYSTFATTVWLKGVDSSFATYPAMVTTHEYGHAWTLLHLYLDHGGDWSAYLGTRWSSTDGAMTLAEDSRMGSSYNWAVSEIIADDYRLLFGTGPELVGSHLNSYVVNPTQQPGLRDWFLTVWK